MFEWTDEYIYNVESTDLLGIFGKLMDSEKMMYY
jgi:hypothetical protein